VLIYDLACAHPTRTLACMLAFTLACMLAFTLACMLSHTCLHAYACTLLTLARCLRLHAAYACTLLTLAHCLRLLAHLLTLQPSARNAHPLPHIPSKKARVSSPLIVSLLPAILLVAFLLDSLFCANLDFLFAREPDSQPASLPISGRESETTSRCMSKVM
jgi:hypothetical protein